jgi:[ribosomal protein S5]-alanine N-acetyltransferase
MELRTTKLKLSELSSVQLQEIHDLHSSPVIDQYNTMGIPGSLAVTETLLNQWLLQQQVSPRINYVFSISDNVTNQFMGLIALNLGKANYRNAEIWYKVSPVYWRKGIATEALQTLLKFGFNDLGLHRIEAGCAVENAASIKVLEKVGMVREGRKRALLPIRGEWKDNFFYAILETDFTGYIHSISSIFFLVGLATFQQ